MQIRSISLFIFVLILPTFLLHAQEHHDCKHHKSSWNPLKFSHQSKAASSGISDSIDLIKHTIFIDLTDFNGFTTRSACAIDFSALTDGISALPLDLKGQQVDSVIHSSGQLDFDHSGEILTISLPETMSSGQTDQVTVFYNGGAVTDPSGFGGFYFNSNIAYNIGVAFSDLPPSYGRAWFPCFDNFVEKSTYEFQILTSGGRSAYCNGLIQSKDTLNGDTLLTTWVMDYEIPSYLASVAVSNYDQINWEFERMAGDTIPVILAGGSQNINNLANAFSNLETVFHAFEEWFGPYRWPRVGYNITPVGAMEHSTNISFPSVLAGTNPQTEPVMAHELAHEWFGNLVTCATSQDMWLNEGWAEFLSILAYEAISGPEEYAARMRSNHRDMLHKAHYLDGGWLTMNNIPPELTYGEHVYNKGALMAHTLRGYLGDDLFFSAMKSYLNTFEYKNASSEDLRDFLNAQPDIDVTDYFNDWIFQPGWAQFSVDEIIVNGSGSEFNVQLEIRQRLREAENFYQNVPVTLSLYDEDWNVFDQQIIVGGELTNLEVIAPFAPVFATLNRDDKLSWAVTATETELTSVGINLLNHSFASCIVNEIQNPVKFRIEKNWVGPGGESENNEYLISPDRYWRVKGLADNAFSFSLRMDFDARPTSNGNLDVKLFDLIGDEFNEENLVVLYRTHPSLPWSPLENIEINTLGSPTNGYARITSVDVDFGEFTFGYPNPGVGINSSTKPATIRLYPNPTRDFVQLEIAPEFADELLISVIATDGKGVLSEQHSGTQIQLSLGHLSSGTYIVEASHRGKRIHQSQLVLK